MKDTFVLRTEYKVSIDEMPDDDAGKLFKVILAYASEGSADVSDMPLSVKMLFPLISGSIRKANEKYEETCAQNKENGRRGGRPKKMEETAETEKPSGFSENRAVFSETDQNPNDNDSDYDSDYEYPKGYKKERDTKVSPKKENAHPLENCPDIDTPEVRAEWEEWVSMRKKIKKPITSPHAAELAVKRLNKLSRGDPIRAVNVLSQSVLNNWQGLFAIDGQKKATQKDEWEEWARA